MEELQKILEKRKDPKYWSNNKRRLHHLPMYRNKKRPNFWNDYKFEIFNIVVKLQDKIIPKIIKENLENFCNIKEI